LDLAALEAITLQDSQGVQHRLGDSWQDERIVLVFLRHFG
jgi:hypothetical protein